MRKLMLYALCGSLAVLAASAWPEAARSAAAGQSSTSRAAEGDARSRFAGTWKLLTIERLGAKGEVLPPAQPPAFGSPNPVGFIVYDAAGYMGVTIMQSGRPKYRGAQPTPEEAKGALLSFTSYFGTFTVNEAEKTVTHHVQGSLNPNNTGTDQKRAFELSGNRIVLKPPRRNDGIQLRLTWERVPDLPKISAYQRQLIGFWKQVSTDRKTFDGKVVRTVPPRTGFLIFTAAGHMAVHLMDADRKKYAAAEPTPEEAQAALRSYGSAYFGPYEVSESERYEVTRQLGTTTPGEAGLAVRHLEFVGSNRVILKPPPEVLDGKLVQGYVNWERVTPVVKSSQ
jgi:hypothetical protein